jgi:hypothetical protein
VEDLDAAPQPGWSELLAAPRQPRRDADLSQPAASDPSRPDPDDLGRLEAVLEDVEHALRRLEEGSYADCEICGSAIDAELLAGDPTTRQCSSHAASS